MQQPFHIELASRVRELSARLVRFGREFTGGLSRRDLERMFDEDAVSAFRALAGDALPGERGASESVKDNLGLFLLQIKAFFLGLAFKLTPARRLLFTASLVIPFLSLFLSVLDVEIGELSVYLDFSPFWFLTSIAGLTLLLSLELVDRLRVRDELDVARELQSELLPAIAPRPPGFEIAHSYRTANEIGGDYYDFLELEDGRLALTVGDASGHGISAGLLMAIANATLKTAIDLDARAPSVLRLLNRTLCRTGGPRAFMTLFYGTLEVKSGQLDYALAGHPFPFLRRASGEIVELGRGALPLGIRPSTTYVPATVTLEPGDLLVLYSDGLPELIGGPNEDAFGFRRLRQILERPGDAETVHGRIIAEMEAHLGRSRLSDDLTLVVLYRHEKVELPPLLGGDQAEA